MSFLTERFKHWRYLAAKKVLNLRETFRNALAAALIAAGNFVALDPSERRVLTVVWLLEGWPGRIFGKGTLLGLLGGKPRGANGDGSGPTSVALTVHRGRHRTDPSGPKVALSCLYQRRTARERAARSAPCKHADLPEERVVWCVYREEKGKTPPAGFSTGDLLGRGPRRALFRRPQAALLAYHSGAPRGCPWPLPKRFADGLFLGGDPEAGSEVGVGKVA